MSSEAEIIRKMIRLRLEIREIKALSTEKKEELTMALRWLQKAEDCIARAEKKK